MQKGAQGHILGRLARSGRHTCRGGIDVPAVFFDRDLYRRRLCLRDIVGLGGLGIGIIQRHGRYAVTVISIIPTICRRDSIIRTGKVSVIAAVVGRRRIVVVLRLADDEEEDQQARTCLLYTSPSPRD